MAEAHRHRGQRGVEPRRDAHRLRQRRQHGASVDAATGQPVGQPLTGHTRAVDSVALSPDGGTYRLRQRRQHGATLERGHRPDTGQPRVNELDDVIDCNEEFVRTAARAARSPARRWCRDWRRELRGDLDRREVHLRQRRHRQPPIAEQAAEHHRDAEQRRRDRPVNERRGDAHCAPAGPRRPPPSPRGPR